MRLHHIGLATDSIADLESLFSDLGLQPSGRFLDEIQGVSGVFYQTEETNCKIELLENLRDSETLSPWLKRGISLYHLGFQVDDIQDSIRVLQRNGGTLLAPPVPAIAFQNQEICFLYIRGFLIELIQK